MISNQNRKIRLWLGLLVINLSLIWGNSLLPGEVSKAISNWVKDVILMLLPLKGNGGVGTGGGGLIRKIAHFVEFTCLGVCLSQVFRMKLEAKLQKVLLPFVCGVAAASVDELIQCFVPDRGPGIRDVLLDSAGVITGIVIVSLIMYIKNKKQSCLEENTK